MTSILKSEQILCILLGFAHSSGNTLQLVLHLLHIEIHKRHFLGFLQKKWLFKK